MLVFVMKTNSMDPENGISVGRDSELVNHHFHGLCLFSVRWRVYFVGHADDEFHCSKFWS